MLIGFDGQDAPVEPLVAASWDACDGQALALFGIVILYI